MIKLINEVKKLAIDYWLRDFQTSHMQVDRTEKVALISKNRLIAEYVDTYIGCCKGNNKISTAKLRKFGSDFYGLVTGDDFESRKRKASKAKPLEISRMFSKANGTISFIDYRT